MPIATGRETHRSEGGNLQKAITDPVDRTHRRAEFATSSHRTWISGIRLSDDFIMPQGDGLARRQRCVHGHKRESACCATSTLQVGEELMCFEVREAVSRSRTMCRSRMRRRLLQPVPVLLHAGGARCEGAGTNKKRKWPREPKRYSADAMCILASNHLLTFAKLGLSATDSVMADRWTPSMRVLTS
jgi:hypothetical protein